MRECERVHRHRRPCDFDSDSAGGCLGAIGIALFIAFVIAVTYVALLDRVVDRDAVGQGTAAHELREGRRRGDAAAQGPVADDLGAQKGDPLVELRANGDQSYDGIFYASTSGTPKVERAERRRFERLCEVLGVEGLMASLEAPDRCAAESA